LRGWSLLGVSVAEVAEEIDLPLAVGKELGIEFFSASKPDMGPQSNPRGACGQDEVGGLQGTVAEGVLVRLAVLFPTKLGADIRLGKELGEECSLEFGVQAMMTVTGAAMVLSTLPGPKKLA